MDNAPLAETETEGLVYEVVALGSNGAKLTGAPTRRYRTEPYDAACYYAQVVGINTTETAGEIRPLGDGVLVVRFRPSTGFPLTVRVTAEGAFWPDWIAKSGNELPRRTFDRSAHALDDEAFAKLAATARVVLN